MSVLLQPKMTFEKFKSWFEKEPVWHRIQIENTTSRDMSKSQKSVIGATVSLSDIYENWYLARVLAN